MESVGVGVYGLGKMGRAHAERIGKALHGARVTAVADPDPQFARVAADQLDLPDVAVEPDAAALFGRDDVAGVLIAAWDGEHEAALLEGLRQGKHIFCEKPLTPTPEASLRVVRAEAATGRRLVQVGFMRRFDAGYLQLKQLLSSDGVGAPLLAYCMHRNVSQPPNFEADQIVTQVMVHEFDIARWLFDDEIGRVRVDRSRPTSRAPKGLADPLTAVLWTRSGVRVNVEAVCFGRYAYDIRCEVLGENGSVALPDPSFPVLRDAHGVNRGIGMDWLNRFEDAYNTEIQAWVDSISSGVSVGPSSWDGYAAQAACGAALASLESGDEVTVDLADKPGIYHF